MWGSGVWIVDNKGNSMLMLNRDVVSPTEGLALSVATAEAASVQVSEGSQALPVAFLITGKMFTASEVFNV